MVIAFAHRGARSERPENTLAAFVRARELGANGLESDAWLARDGEVVLVHDAAFRRGLRKIRVAEHTASELAEYDVPRLVDLYRECGTDFELSIDAKQPEVIGPMAEIARAAGGDAAHRLWICSPDLDLLRSRREELADVRLVHSPGFRGVAPAAFERHASDLASAGIDALNLHHSDWTLGTVTLVHRFELAAFAWDAQEMRHVLAALRYGIDGVFSDRVDRMLAAIGEWSAG
ncbi:MAG: glycerophosphodiester phosphodiesterase [Acidimicrobiia bacterium]|nr:glycerophosphodiester phosphodiesterase [Acidimicrobiia bacterium]